MTVLHPVRVVMCPVRLMVHHCEMCLRPGVMPVPRTVNIMAVVPVDIPGVMCEMVMVIIMQVQMPDSGQSSKMIVRDVHMPRLNDPTVVIIIDGYVLHLDHRSKIIILYKGIIVIA